ncbi:hypothetical protein D3C77_646820 [compost metagenome]
MAAARVSSDGSAIRLPLTKKDGVPVTPAATAPSTSACRAWPTAGSLRQASICSWLRPLAATASVNQARASPFSKASAWPRMRAWATSKNLSGAAQRAMPAAVAATWAGAVGMSRNTSRTLPVSM